MRCEKRWSCRGSRCCIACAFFTLSKLHWFFFTEEAGGVCLLRPALPQPRMKPDLTLTCTFPLTPLATIAPHHRRGTL